MIKEEKIVIEKIKKCVYCDGCGDLIMTLPTDEEICSRKIDFEFHLLSAGDFIKKPVKINNINLCKKCTDKFYCDIIDFVKNRVNEYKK